MTAMKNSMKVSRCLVSSGKNFSSKFGVKTFGVTSVTTQSVTNVINSHLRER